MRARLTKLGAMLAALAALAVGGSALASAAGGGGSQPATTLATAQQSSANANASASDPSGQADTDSIQGDNGKDDTAEPAGTEQNDATETAETGSETPGDDGPAGHADEPGNPAADHQSQGQN
jgi:hypothetical protein